MLVAFSSPLLPPCSVLCLHRLGDHVIINGNSLVCLHPLPSLPLEQAHLSAVTGLDASTSPSTAVGRWSFISGPASEPCGLKSLSFWDGSRCAYEIRLSDSRTQEPDFFFCFLIILILKIGLNVFLVSSSIQNCKKEEDFDFVTMFKIEVSLIYNVVVFQVYGNVIPISLYIIYILFFRFFLL